MESMELMELGTTLVRMCNAGEDEAFVEAHYAADVVSIEAQGSDEMPARAEGIEAIRAKGDWWRANHEMHALSASGPYIGHRADQFAVRFALDVTPKGAERMQMEEVALYTVRDGKIAQEEFLYLMG